VVIVGFSRPDLNEAALFSDIYASYELWGLNSLFVMLEDRHFDRWFEIHDRKYLGTSISAGYAVSAVSPSTCSAHGPISP
jgi:hypothetical protein